MSKVKTRRLNVRTWNAAQSWTYQALWAVDGRTVRVHIKRNAYDEQSFEHAELFDGDRWNLVVAWPIGPALKDVTYARKNLRPEDLGAFADVEAKLVAEVALILS